VKEIMNLGVKTQAAVFCINRNKGAVPLKEISIMQENHGYKFGVYQVKDPYGFTYMPEIIDVYPDNDINPGIAMVLIILIYCKIVLLS
jgi:hypothetical protein